MKKILDQRDLLLLPILLLGAFIRFYTIPHQYILDPDAVRDAIVSIVGAQVHYFPLAGAFSSTGPYTFGPWYYIGIILAQTIIPSIYTPWISMGIASMLIIFFMYKLGELLESKNFGLLVALLTSVAPSEIIAGTGLSNIFAVPLFTTLALVITAKIVKTKKSHLLWYFLLGICLGLAISAHYQAVGLLFLPLFLWVYKRPWRYQTLLSMFFGLAITFIPLLLFNLHMNWHTIRGIQEMYLSRVNIYVANSWKIYVFQFWPGLIGFILGTPFILSCFVLLGIAVSFSWHLYKRTVPAALILFAGVLFINFLWLRYYWGERSFGYHYFLEPLIILFTGYMLYSLKRLPFGIFFFGILFIEIYVSSLIGDMHRISPPEWMSEAIKNETGILEQTYPDNTITIYACNVSPDVHAEGIAYLLTFEQKLHSSPIKIGVVSSLCKNPQISPYSPISDTNSATILSTIKDTSLLDFSHISDTTLKQASWSAVSTNEIFTKTVKWY